MLSVLDIILICVGAVCVVVYTTLKILQFIKYKKLVKKYMQDGMKEEEAKTIAYKQIFLKNKKNNEDYNNDEIYED